MELESPRSISLCEPSLPESPIGRVMGVLLASRHRHLDAAVRRLGVDPARSVSGSLLDESLCFLWRHVQGAVEKGESLDEVLVPMIEHSLIFKEPKHSKQVAALLAWLFRDDHFAHAISSHLVGVLKKKDDHFVAHGWCKLVIMMVTVLFNQNFDNGKQEDKIAWMKILWQSVLDLSCIICKESTWIDGFELPTRLAAASADCMLVLFEALMRCSTLPSPALGKITDLSLYHNQLTLLESTHTHGNVGKPRQNQCHCPVNMEIGLILWDSLDQLMILIAKLKEWSKKSQSLHAEGLELLFKWLESTKLHYDSLREEAGDEMLKEGIVLLCSCWKQYGRLLRLNDARCILDHDKILEQLLGALQFYSCKEEVHCGEIDGSIETRKFFLNCIALLLGRLHGKHLQVATSKHAQDLLPLLFAQLQDNDRDLAEGAVGIIRGTLLVNNLSPGNHPLDAYQMEHLSSLLLKFLNEHDSASLGIVQLAAECCYLYPEGQGFQEMLDCFADGSVLLKRNILNVVSAVICLDSGNTLPSGLRNKISKILVQGLRTGLISKNINVPKLFPRLDATIVLPELLHLVCSKDENLKTPATEALIAMLSFDVKDFSLFFMAIDYISNYRKTFGISEDNQTKSPSGLKLDADTILSLLLKSSEKVEGYTILIDKLIDRLFADPSNAMIVRLMSYFSDFLAQDVDLVFHRVLTFMCSENELNKRWRFDNQELTSADDNLARTNDSLFSHLCPLLLLKVLPLTAYDNLSCSDLYGQMVDTYTQKDISNCGNDCIAGILFDRAFCPYEYEDVRRVSTELCGRLYPQVLLPIIANHLEDAVRKRDTLRIKACLFALCTSLVVRGMSFVFGKYMCQIRNLIDVVLSWPSLESDEVSKAQHGCIDCLALLICAEMRPSESIVHDHCKDPSTEESVFMNQVPRTSTLESVIQKMMRDEISVSSYSRSIYLPDESPSGAVQNDEAAPDAQYAISFRLCMANALISAYQKAPNSSKSLFGSKTLPLLIAGIEEVTVSEVRAACLQVLFSAVYNLKATVFPFASDLFKLAMKALKKGSEKEKIAAAKLMASLMASNDEILDSISDGLPEAKAVLAHVFSTASSSELRKVCQQLLLCLTTPLSP